MIPPPVILLAALGLGLIGQQFRPRVICADATVVRAAGGFRVANSSERRMSIEQNKRIVRQFIEDLTRFEWTGTHRGSFLGVNPTGRPVRVWGVD